MKGDFSRISFSEKKHYSEVLLQQGRVQLDADWNEAAAIETNRDERALRDVIGGCGSPNTGFQIAARMMLDPMESAAGWSAAPAGAGACVDYVDYLRGTGSLRVSGATEIHKDLGHTIDLRGAGAVLCFAVKSAKAPPPVGGTQNDTGFTFYVADTGGKKVSWAVAGLTAQIVGVWRVYTCPLASPPANLDNGLTLSAIKRIGFDNLKADWTYHFDSIQRDFAPASVPLQDILALDDLEDLRGWSVPALGTGSVSLDGGSLFSGRPTVRITGPGDGLKSFVEPRDLRIYRRVITTTKLANQASAVHFFLKVAGQQKRIELQDIGSGGSTDAAGWTTHIADLPADPDLGTIESYGFDGLDNGATLHVAQVLVQLTATNNFYILGADASGPGRLYVDGIACQKESAETYYNQRAYPEALPLAPGDKRVDLVYVDVWERHVTYVEDPELREVALGGPDTCTRLQTVAQVKVLGGDADNSTSRLDCADIPATLKNKFTLLTATGQGTLSTLVAPPAPPDDLCRIAPDADYLGLDNRLYRVEIHDPGAVGTAKFKWSKNNGSLAVGVIEDVAANQTPQTIRVERLGRDRATTIAVDDWVEIADDLTDLADSGYGGNGLPVRRTGELAQVKAVDPDTNAITLKAPLTRGYTVARHAKVRKWDGAGPHSMTAEFAGAATTPQLDFGDGVQVTFDGGSQKMLTGDYWQFTARGITGQIEKLDHALPAGVVHHYCPLALIKWKQNAAGLFEIVDIADCRNHFPALTDIQATDVAYNDGCCGLTEDVKTLAIWHGDVLDDPTSAVVEGKVANVQQALDTLCAREHEYLVLRYVSGDGQEGLPGETLPAPLIVAVENVLGEPQKDVPVDFTVVQGGGSLAGLPAKTDQYGEAKVNWTLGTPPGLNLVKASLNTPQTGTPEIIFNARGLCANKICYQDTQCNLTADFNLLGHAGAVDTVQEALDTLCERESRFLVLRYVSGDGQEGLPDEELPAKLVVAVVNLLGEPQADVEVQFKVLTAGDDPKVAGVGSVTPGAPVRTGGNGEARVAWTLGTPPGLNLVQASLNTPQAGTPEVIFNARGAVLAGQGLCTITVGDGKISHGQYNGYTGLVEALKMVSTSPPQGLGGGTICILRGTYELKDTIVVAGGQNIAIHGSGKETVLQGGGGKGEMALRFEGCDGVEVRDLQVVVKPARTSKALDALVAFSNCSRIVVERCRIRGDAIPSVTSGVENIIAAPFACLLIERARLKDLGEPGPLVSACEFLALGEGPLTGVGLDRASGARVTKNLIAMLVREGGYGIALEDNSDGCLVADNNILGMGSIALVTGKGSLGGIHVGSGCEDMVVRDNQIGGGDGFGIGLGSVSTEARSSLGGVPGLTIQGNVIQGMAMSGIGVLGFTGSATAMNQPVTDHLLISANRIKNCAFGRGQAITPPGSSQTYRPAGGLALWMGESIQVVDNDIRDNGPVPGGNGFAPHPVCGVVIAFPGPGLMVSRNRIIGNVSAAPEDPDKFIGFRGGIVVHESSAAGEAQPTAMIVDNEVVAPSVPPPSGLTPGGPALFCAAGSDAPMQVLGNHFYAEQLGDPAVEIRAKGPVQFNGNHVSSRLLGEKVPSAVRIRSDHITFGANHCLCRGQLPGLGHVVIEGPSASATGNHCLEEKTHEKVPSLLIRGDNGAIIAVANVTTNGVELDPPNAATNVANASGVIA